MNYRTHTSTNTNLLTSYSTRYREAEAIRNRIFARSAEARTNKAEQQNQAALEALMALSAKTALEARTVQEAPKASATPENP